MPRLSIALAVPLLGLALAGVAQDHSKTHAEKPKARATGPVRITQDTQHKTKQAAKKETKPAAKPAAKQTTKPATHDEAAHEPAHEEAAAPMQLPAHTEPSHAKARPSEETHDDETPSRNATRQVPRTVRSRLTEPAAAPAAPVADTISSPAGSLEVWLYEQERRRYEDPKQAVRRRAEFRANQRQRRIESRKWYGISNARPLANPTPLTSAYSHQWAGHRFAPFLWQNSPSIVITRRTGYGLW